jgi:hypothetical protein
MFRLAGASLMQINRIFTEVMAQTWEILAELRRLKTEPEESLSD